MRFDQNIEKGRELTVKCAEVCAFLHIAGNGWQKGTFNYCVHLLATQELKNASCICTYTPDIPQACFAY